MTDLAGTLALLEEVGPRYGACAGPPEPRRARFFTPLSALVDEPGVLERLLEGAGARWSTPDVRVQIAFVAGPLLGRLLRVACGCLMLGAPVPRMRAEDVLVRFGETGLAQELRLVGPPVASAAGGVERIRDELLGTHLASLIDHLRVVGGPGRPTLWGAAADALAGACLELGRALGDEELGRRAGAELVERCRPPLRRPARYLRLAGGGRAELAVALQSCCLAHRLPNGTRCASCPLRSEDDRRRRLGARLARSRAPRPVLAGAAGGGS